MRRVRSCLFCREATPVTDEECDQLRMKRIEANDPVAICFEGLLHYNKGDYSKAFEYYTKATKLGDVEAHYELSILYRDGKGVDEDEGEQIHHMEEAAIGGHPEARYNLGNYEWNNMNNGDKERAVKHWIISATQGCDSSIKALLEGFRQAYVEKEVLAAALRAHQAAVDATKSPQRKAAEEADE